MSASNKKKLRREQDASALTEKQQQELKEAKKLKIYTGIFIAVMALMVVIVIWTTINNTIIKDYNDSKQLRALRENVAVTVGERNVNTVDLSYFYVDAINRFYSDNSSYLSWYGLDVTKPLNEQYIPGTTETTWADYFLQTAESNMQSVYALYNEAEANNFVLPEADEMSIRSTLSNMSTYAIVYYGYPDLDTYLKAIYCAGADVESFENYCRISQTAQSYSDAHNDALTYTDADFRAAEADNYAKYSSFSYNYYYLPVSSFLEGGDVDAEGKVTYTDAQRAAAVTAAEDAAKALTADTITSTVLLDKEIAHLSINADNADAASTAYTDRTYSSINSLFQEWVTDSSRKEGDKAYFPNTSTSTDADGNEVTTTSSFYVVYYVGSTDNIVPLTNVRHILIGIKGGTTGSDGSTVYTDEAKAEAMTEAQGILDGWLADGATEEGFAALAEEHSTDTGSKSNGGLYEDIYPGQMVEAFNDWCFDPARKPGDYGIVETNYGYHIMYFVGNSDMTFRDFMIDSELRANDMNSWMTALVESCTVTEKDTSLLNKALVLSQSR